MFATAGTFRAFRLVCTSDTQSGGHRMDARPVRQAAAASHGRNEDGRTKTADGTAFLDSQP